MGAQIHMGVTTRSGSNLDQQDFFEDGPDVTFKALNAMTRASCNNCGFNNEFSFATDASAFAEVDISRGTVRGRAQAGPVQGGFGADITRSSATVVARFDETVSVVPDTPDLLGDERLFANVTARFTGSKSPLIDTNRLFIYQHAVTFGAIGTKFDDLETRDLLGKTVFDELLSVNIPFYIPNGVRGGLVDLRISGRMGFGVGPDEFVNATNTAQLGIELPDGFSFTSESGVFLTQAPDDDPPARVPAPSVAVLILSGLGILGAVRLRKH